MQYRLAGSGGKGGGSRSRSPVESANTLFNQAFGTATFFVGRGPLRGFVDPEPLKSIYFDRTPPLTAAGEELIEGVGLEWRLGTPDQPAMSQHRQQSAFPVSVEIKSSLTDGLTRQFGGEDYANVLVRYRIPQLYEIDDEGNTNLAPLHFQILRSTDGGPFVLVHDINYFDKTDQAFEDSLDVPLPQTANRIWAIRLIKVTRDATSVREQNQLLWVDYTLVRREGSTFSGIAVASVQVDSENFSSIPAFSADMYGLSAIPIPHNYDGINRVFSGTFNGSLTPSYTNDPAWVLWWLLTSPRDAEGFGVPAEYLDVFSFYETSQRNSERIRSAYGQVETRYTYNRYMASRRDSQVFRDEILASMHCRIGQAGSKYILVQDKPQSGNPVLVNQADCIVQVDSEGIESDPISYQYTELGNLYTVIEVEFLSSEIWEYDSVLAKDDGAIARWGYRYKKIRQDRAMTAGEALREARWQLYSALFQNRVTFTLGDFAFNLTIGRKFTFADGTSLRASGRLRAVGANWVELDDVVDPVEIGGNPILLTNHPTTGEQQQNQIFGFVGARLNLAAPFANMPQQWSGWAIRSDRVSHKVYTCVSIKPRGGNYEIIGVEYKDGKWAYIDTGVAPGGTLIELPSIRIPDTPINLTFDERLVDLGDRFTNNLNFSWGTTENDRGFVRSWEAAILRQGEHAWTLIGRPTTQRVEILDLDPGFYQLRVRAMSPYKTPGPYARLPVQVAGKRQEIGNVENFALSAIGQGDAIRLTWDPSLNPLVIHAGSIQIRHSNSVSAIWQGSAILATEAGTSTSVVVPALAGVYFAKWIVPTELLESPSEARITTTGVALVQRNFISRFCEQDTNFSGVKENVGVISAQSLTMLDISQVGYYYWSQELRFNTVQTIDITTDTVWYAIEFDEILELYDDPPGALHDDSEPGELHDSLNRFDVARYRGNLYDDYDGLHDDDFPGLLHDDSFYSGDVSFTKEIQISTDGINFSDWFTFQPGRFSFLAAKVRNKFESFDGKSNIYLDRDCLIVDALDRVASGTAISSDTTAVRVLFDPPFNVSPEGVEITIQEGTTIDEGAGPVVIVGYQPNDYHSITNIDELGFNVDFRNVSNIEALNPEGRVRRRFHWLTEAF